MGPTDAARSDRSCKLHYYADLKIQCFPGSTITERLEYLFDHYGRYKQNLLEARNGLKHETLTQEALVENFKQMVTDHRGVAYGDRHAPHYSKMPLQPASGQRLVEPDRDHESSLAAAWQHNVYNRQALPDDIDIDFCAHCLHLDRLCESCGVGAHLEAVSVGGQ